MRKPNVWPLQEIAGLYWWWFAVFCFDKRRGRWVNFPIATEPLFDWLKQCEWLFQVSFLNLHFVPFFFHLLRTPFDWVREVSSYVLCYYLVTLCEFCFSINVNCRNSPITFLYPCLNDCLLNTWFENLFTKGSGYDTASRTIVIRKLTKMTPAWYGFYTVSRSKKINGA